MESALFPEPDEKQTNNKTTLLSNLTETNDNKLFEEDADLFGNLGEPAASDISIDAGGGDLFSESTANGAANPNAHGLASKHPLSVPEPIEKPSEPISSKLAFSGLLGDTTVKDQEGSAGLFDDIPDQLDHQEPVEQQPVVETVPNGQEQNDENEVMHELNLNELDSFGMGMGLGGAIPKEEVIFPPEQQQQQMPGQPQGVMNAMAGSYYYSTSGAGQMHLPQQPQMQQPSVFAGMHVGHNVNIGGVHSQQPYPSIPKHAPPKVLTDYVTPPPFHSPYGKITITDPMLIQGTGLFAGPPHWTYLVTLYSKESQPISAVRRRFRHFVALESRIRLSVPGAILPPRPEKHPTRAIEEASPRQSAEFAQQRSNELSIYMNELANHPYVASCPDLKLFLTLQDHIGTAWPEVSGSAFTRLTAVGTASVEKLADTMDGILSDTATTLTSGEDNAEILALAAYEGRRIGAVSGSVPKIEGTVNVLKEKGDRCGATGLEMSKLAKDVAWCDRELSGPMDVLSSALLRSGRRTKRLGVEVGVGIASFVTQYKLCKYEQMAFDDRRITLKRRSEVRGSADRRAAKVIMNQTSMTSMGKLGTLEKMEMEAAMFDEMATEASREADEVASRLQSEVGRIGSIRVKEWDAGLRVVASAMKEACTENIAIWETALECFHREFPDMQLSDRDVIEDGN